MQFNPHPKKQANEIMFSWKSNTRTYPSITFNNNVIVACPHRKHLGVALDSKLDFSIHIEQKIKNFDKIIEIIRSFLSALLPGKAILTNYKFFVRPHLSYGDILFDKPGNLNVESKIKKAQYKACIAIIDVIQMTFGEQLDDKLGLMLLSKRRWYSKFTIFCKIVNGLLPDSSSFLYRIFFSKKTILYDQHQLVN